MSATRQDKENEQLVRKINMQILKKAWLHFVGPLKEEKRGTNFYRTLGFSTNAAGNNPGIPGKRKATMIDHRTGLKREFFLGTAIMTISTIETENLEISRIKEFLGGHNEKSKQETEHLLDKAIENIHLEFDNGTDLYKWCYFIQTGTRFDGLGAEPYKKLTLEAKRENVDESMQRLKALTKYEWMDMDEKKLEEYKGILDMALKAVSIVAGFKNL